MTSHLLQMRGLKQTQQQKAHHEHHVASFTDAWIETSFAALSRVWRVVASFTDAWIETRALAIFPEKMVVASFTDAWIETQEE